MLSTPSGAKEAPRCLIVDDHPVVDRNSSSIGSINGEWNACETRSRLVCCGPRARRRGGRREYGVLGAPEITTEGRPVDGRDADHAQSVSGLRTSSSAAASGDHRAAGRQSLHEPAPRGDASVHASGSDEHPGDVRGGQLTDRVPGEHDRGRTPHDSSSRNRATSIANNACWVF